MKDITNILLQLYQEVTPDGKILLDKLIDIIIEELEKIKQKMVPD